MRRALVSVVITVTLLGACSLGGDETSPGAAPGGGEDVVDSGGLPQSCDELVTPLSVATALNAEPAGGRSAVYSPPNQADGTVVGMTCSFGVGEGQPAVTVEAVAHGEEDSAADQFASITRIARRQATSQESVELLNRPGLLVRSADSSAYYVLDGRRTLVFTVTAATVSSEQAPSVLTELAEAVVDGILSTEGGS